MIGHPHSEALRILERYHRRDFGHMDVEMTFDDPQMYTKPFTIKFTQDLWADSDIFENFCKKTKRTAPTWCKSRLTPGNHLPSTHLKLAASSELPEPEYRASCG